MKLNYLKKKNLNSIFDNQLKNFFSSSSSHPLFKDENFSPKEWIKENCSITQPSLLKEKHPQIKVKERFFFYNLFNLY